PPVLLVLAIFLLVVGGLMEGYFTPTEAGSVGTFAVLILTVAQKGMTFKLFKKAVFDTLRIACMVISMIAGATIMGHFFLITRMPYHVAEWLGGLNLPPLVIMLIVVVVYVIGGSFIEHLAFLILATPVFLPLVIKLGYDPIWFGVIVCVVTMIGVILPPLAINAFVVVGVTGEKVGTVYKGNYPYLIGMTIILFILMVFPEISLWFPTKFMR
ncbi:MAG: TRAP transporter large permease subunit, partial [Deltaproteobacteria bacterium]|nr:TRAP transporter large permease subunit [Deltaproteobacteria bacterium]